MPGSRPRKPASLPNLPCESTCGSAVDGRATTVASDMISPLSYQDTDFRTPKRMTSARARESSTAHVSRERAMKEGRRVVAGIEVSLEKLEKRLKAEA